MKSRIKTFLCFLTLALCLAASSALGAIAVTYDQPTNVMEVTGGTEGTPATFVDLVQHDFDTPLLLLDAHAISNDPETVPLEAPVRAADSRALALTITVDADRAGATADIIGRDVNGDSISESGLDISDALTTPVQTANKYSEISTLGIVFNGLTAGDEVTVTQPRLGVINAGVEPDVVVNGGFYEDSDWTLENEVWTISEGVANGNGAAGITDNIVQISVFIPGEIYKVVYTVDDIGGGGEDIRFRAGSSANWGITHTTNGTFIEFIEADEPNIAFQGNISNGFSGSIDNVSAQKLTGSYQIGCNVAFGDGSTSSWFDAKNTVSYFETGFSASTLSFATLVKSSISFPVAEVGRYPIQPETVYPDVGDVKFGTLYGNDSGLTGTLIKRRPRARRHGQ